MIAVSRTLFVCGCIALLAALTAAAGERAHVVQDGESASAIAKHYYGDYELAGILLLFNDRQTPTIHPGETLRVPLCDVHRVRAGDTWSKLSRRYLGDASRWSTVAELNGLVPERALQIGQEIVFPVVLGHSLRRGETLAGLAERFWGDPGRARLLQEFNGVDDPRRLSLGAVVDVPLLTLRPRPRSQRPSSPVAHRVAASGTPPRPRAEKTVLSSPKPADSVAAEPVATDEADDADTAIPEDHGESALVTAPPQPVVAPPRFKRELGNADRAFRLGEYEKAQALLESLRGPMEARGTGEDRRDFWRQLGFVHVAFDRGEDACLAFAAMARVGGALEPDPVRISPKISTALQACP